MRLHGPADIPTAPDDSAHLADLRDAAPDPIRWAFLAAVHLLRVGRASLLVFHADERELTVAASVGIDPAVVPTIRVRVGSGIAGLVAERDMAVIADARGTAYISVPVHGARGVVGVLNLTNKLDGQTLTDSDLQTARSIADHLGYLLQGASDSGLDARTGLPDRWAFEDLLQRELARSARTGDVFSLISVRLGGLDDALRRLGQVPIAATLRAVADTLRSAVRRYDIVAWGDGGYLLLFPGAKDPTTIAPRMLAVARQGIRPHETGVVLDVGWVRGPADGTSAEALLARVARRVQEVQIAR